MTAAAPVGVLDSGLGGLSVLRALRATLPHEDFLYCADCAHAPWGDRPADFVLERCRAICGFMIERGVKAVVLACNTATALAADALRAEFSVPIVGIEPAVKPAAAASRRAKIGVLATAGTIRSARYRSLVERFAHNAEVVSVEAPGLMECVERGDFASETTRALLARYLEPMRRAGVDKVVLGCTHYPFLAGEISRLMGPGVELIEPGAAVAAVARTRLAENNCLRGGRHAGSESFWISGCTTHAAVLRTLWPHESALKPAELTV